MYELTKNDTNILKGVALLLLLCHHLFYINNGLYDDIFIVGHGLVNEFGKVCKVCVPIFVFLSGYGLTKSYQGKRIEAWTFYRNRMAKLFLNYWLIWLLFVPLGVFVFGRTFEAVYIDHIPIRFLLDFGGLAYTFGFYGYNATWWFMSCIIMLYLLYPALWFRGGQSNILIFLLFVSMMFSLFHIPYLMPIRYYLMTFIAGMLFASTNLLTKYPLTTPLKKSLCFIVLLFCILIRNKLSGYTLQFDTVNCIIGIVLYANIRINNGLLQRTLAFIGKHSMNIFLFHTFIFAYFFQELIYAPKNPIVIFLFLLGICLIISVLIEKLKGLLLFQRLEFYIRNSRK